MSATLPAGPPLTLSIDGQRFDDIAGFYREINRVFMADEDWQLGESLDALDDMLYGGYGVLNGAGPVRLVWSAMDKSAGDLGLAETRRWLTAKLAQPAGFNIALIQAQLAELEVGTGQTFFQIVLEILAVHQTIELVPA